MHRVSVAAAIALAVTAAGCSSGGVGSVESDLAEHYLEPMTAAGMPITVENTCHLPREADSGPWHLEVRLAIDADRDAVADLLEDRGVVVVRDRDPMVVQQERADSATGWNGALGTESTGSSLGLTYNNVELDGAADAGGWLEVCTSTGTP